MKFQRIFVIVLDSVGIGALPDAHLFNDVGANTLVHTAASCGGLSLPNLARLGLGHLDAIAGVPPMPHPQSYITTLREISSGKDTMTGHWELMGIETKKPFKTFTETGFPQELIETLKAQSGHDFIGNVAASGTEIIAQLGEEHMRTKKIILYTSADSVLQLAAHESVIPLAELYRVCELARSICMQPEYLLGRIIARPFIGTQSSNFKRTPNRHDYALSPGVDTALDVLSEAGFATTSIGKIYDIFNGQGIAKSQKTISNMDGMQKTIIESSQRYQGLIFVNLVEFDSEFGHRRDPKGYGRALEQFDRDLGQLLPKINHDDLLMITADHGNDPTHHGTDHTRERVPLIMYSPQFSQGRFLPERSSFADVASTILKNFQLQQPQHHVGQSIDEILI
jgi:phosphopentomutase